MAETDLDRAHRIALRFDITFELDSPTYLVRGDPKLYGLREEPWGGRGGIRVYDSGVLDVVLLLAFDWVCAANNLGRHEANELYIKCMDLDLEALVQVAPEKFLDTILRLLLPKQNGVDWRPDCILPEDYYA